MNQVSMTVVAFEACLLVITPHPETFQINDIMFTAVIIMNNNGSMPSLQALI